MGKDLKGKELGVGICQRKDGSYCARYVDRFGKRKSIYEKNIKILKLKLNEAIYENNAGSSLADNKTTLDEWNKKWMSVYKNPVIRENTKRHYEHIYSRHISPALGMCSISEITQLQIKELVNNLNDAGYRWETQNKVKILLTDMFNRAMEDNFAKRNPAKGVRLAKNKPNDRFVLSIEQQAEFFECSAGTFYDNLFVVAVNSGLRPGELFALTWDDIDIDNMEINVDKTLLYQKLDGDEKKEFHLGPPKTMQSIRKVPINRKCEIALKKQFVLKKIIETRSVRNVEFSDRLFVTSYNTPLNSVLFSDAIKKIVKEINIQKDNMEKMEVFSGHTFRHTFATRCIESGILPKIVQSYLGHATLQMTMDLYVHTTSDFKELEMKKLENMDVSVSEKTIEQRFAKEGKIVNMRGVRVV